MPADPRSADINRPGRRLGGRVLFFSILLVLVATCSGTVGIDPGYSDLELELRRSRHTFAGAAKLSLRQAIDEYRACRERGDLAGYAGLSDHWADHLRTRALDAPTKGLTEIAFLLHDDGYEADDLLNRARETHTRGKYIRSGRAGKQIWIENKTYIRVVELLGWSRYSMPLKFDDYGRWAFPEFKKYNRELFDLQTDYDREWTPPDKAEHLKELEDAVWKVGRALEKRHAEDGFAINAREAFVRFLEANRGGKVDRRRGRRSFSPKALNRPALDDPTGNQWEPIQDIWTYTYAEPFVVFVERQPGEPLLNPAREASLVATSDLLQQLEAWFREHLIERFGLERVRPLGSGGEGRDGKTYDTKAELAEADGWPMQIVVLKDEQTYLRFIEDTIGRGIPGAREHYSPPDEGIVTWDDSGAPDSTDAGFHQSIMIHEAFHMLSDHYAANPIGKSDDLRPRYANILVQEGLTDSVAGFSKEGEGGDATYKFLQVNYRHLRNWQQTYKALEDKNIYRIRDMLRATNYSQCNQIGYERWQELGLSRPRGFVIASQRGFLGLYYATACTASYFFQNYRKGGSYPYRNKWWEYIGKDYKGEIGIPTTNPQAGIDAFKRVFGIESDADWEAMEREFEEFTKALAPEGVGKGGGDSEIPPEED